MHLIVNQDIVGSNPIVIAERQIMNKIYVDFDKAEIDEDGNGQLTVSNSRFTYRPLQAEIITAYDGRGKSCMGIVLRLSDKEAVIKINKIVGVV